MPALGRPYPIIYEAKNFKSGLTTIIGKVRKPDGTFITLSFVEISESGFEGTYISTLFTSSSSDPEGEYLGVVIEPDGYKASFRASLEKPQSGTLPGDVGINRRNVLDADVSLKGLIEGEVSLPDVIVAVRHQNEVEAYFYKDDLEKFLDNTDYIGEIS